ncbi:MAG: cyclic nucleotide-binding domain-containing protein [Parachlamydiales bacterium]
MADFRKNFTKEEWEEISTYYEEKSYESSEEILKFGEIKRDFYYLKSGVADVFITNIEGNEIKLGDISEGTLFGEMGFLDGHPASVVVKAQTEVIVDTMDNAKFMELKSKNIELAFKFLWFISCLLANRLRITSSKLKIASLEQDKNQKYATANKKEHVEGR